MKSSELQFYDNYVFNSNNHKLLKVPDVLLELIINKFTVNEFWNVISNLETSFLDVNNNKAIRNFLFSKPLFKKQDIDVLNKCDQLQLVVTNACNMKCRYCYANEGTYNKESELMSFEMMKKTIDIFFQRYSYIKTVMFFGGEPFLNEKAIIQTCEYLDRFYFDQYDQINIMTNLYNLSDRMIQAINKYSVNIITSIDGDEQENDANRIDRFGKGTYRRVCNNILKLKRKTGQPIKIQATIETDNYEQFNKRSLCLMKKISTEFNIHLSTINKVHETESYTPTLHDDSENIRERLNLIDQIDMLINYKILTDDLIQLYYFILGKKNRYRCQTGLNMFSVFPDGDINPCQLFALDKKSNYLLGNVSKIKNLNNKKFISTQKKLENILNKEKDDICSSCLAKEVCFNCVGLKVSTNEKLKPLKDDCNSTINKYHEFINSYIYLYEHPKKYHNFLITAKSIINDFNNHEIKGAIK